MKRVFVLNVNYENNLGGCDGWCHVMRFMGADPPTSTINILSKTAHLAPRNFNGRCNTSGDGWGEAHPIDGSQDAPK